MIAVSWDDFAREADAFDADVARTPAIDHYCSSTAWILPAHAAFHADNPPLVLRSGAGWAALCAGHAPSIGRYCAPLESMWGLASPLAGASPVPLALDVYKAMRARRGDWDALWFGGLSPESELFHALASLFAALGSVRLGPTSMRYAASLEGGWDGWLGRRSPRFRANLRRATRRAEGEGVRFEPLDDATLDPAAVYARILAIEERSWKGSSGQGITTGGMREFYERALALLIPRGAFRCLVATRDDRDVGFIFGGVFGGSYRGLQVSFDEACRDLSLGNVLQGRMIARLAAEGVGTYDLGSEIAYKARWSEPGLTTATLVVLQR